MTVTTPLGQVLRDEEGMRLEFVRSYDNPIEDVWSAFTEPDRVARWFGSWTGDPATGTVEVLLTEDEGSTPQTVMILECQPPTRLVVDLPSPDGTWRLSVSLRCRTPTPYPAEPGTTKAGTPTWRKSSAHSGRFQRKASNVTVPAGRSRA